jgi:hypothetical protein
VAFVVVDGRLGAAGRHSHGPGAAVSYRHNTRDANERELLAVAERLGAHWLEAAPLDGWIWFRGQWLPVEIKVPEREGLAHEYTPLQRRFMNWCRLRNARWLVWRTADDVLRDLGGRRAA